MKRKHTIQKILTSSYAFYTYICLILIVIFNSVLMLNFIPSSSMESTLLGGDIILTKAWNVDKINRYDIIVFLHPEIEENPKTLYIKRVIGLPGDTVEIRDNQVYINGELTNEEFVTDEMKTLNATYVVPENSYFVMGDNRNHSRDSRFWENPYVSTEEIKGKAVSVLYPLDHVQSLITSDTSN